MSGTMTPDYEILGVVYAPPGAAPGGVASSVNYGSTSAVGSSHSITSSFDATKSLSVSVSASFFGFLGTSASASFEAGKTSSNGESMAITKTTALTIVSSGDRSANGFTHDNDQILLWGNPTYSVSVTGSAVNLMLGNIAGGSLDWQPVFVGQLDGNSHYSISPGLQSWLLAHGISTAEYPNVLAADPLAVPGAVLDPNRFIPASTNIPYDPPPFPGGPTNQITYTQSTSTTFTNTVAQSQTHTHKFTAGGDASFLGFLKTSLSVSDQIKTTHGWQNQDTRTGTQSASVTIGSPSFGYTGPVDIAVYWDALWHVWAFAPIVIPPGGVPPLQGVVVDALGHPVAGQELLVLGSTGQVQQTFTNQAGQYRIWTLPPGSGSVTTATGTAAAFTRLGSAAVTLNIVQ